MKKVASMFGTVISAVALLITGIVANSACGFIVHQPKLPARAKELRKF